jgi:hypothetical protein
MSPQHPGPGGADSNDLLGARFDAWMSSPASDVDLHGSIEGRMRAAWNAAITQAADRCEAVCHYYQTRQRWTSPDEAADTCKDEVRKLRSACAQG